MHLKINSPSHLQKQLENAISIALTAHKGIVDKGGAPYILHPIRVMLAVDSIEEKIVAVLHDVLEDSLITSRQLLRRRISKELLDALYILTRKKDQTYENYIIEIKRNPLAAKVKIADLLDNMNITRLKKITQEDELRLEKYKKALMFLNE